MPDNLKTWLERLASSPLPVLASTRAELGDLMSRDQLSVMLYAQPLQHDPGLATQLVKSANIARNKAGRRALTSMPNVLSHLGQGAIRQQLQSTKNLSELNLPEPRRLGYLRYVAQACHASHQARDWALQRGANEPDEVQLAALLCNISELSLWCYGGDTMATIEYQVYAKKQPYEKAAQNVLGCTMSELSAALAERWQLSELAVDAMRIKQPGFTLAHGVALASQLARLTAYSWYDRNARQCVEAIAAYQGKAIGDVESRLHQCALELTELFVHLDYRPPAAQLPMLVDEKYVDDAFVIKQAADPSPSRERPAPPQPKPSSARPASPSRADTATAPVAESRRRPPEAESVVVKTETRTAPVTAQTRPAETKPIESTRMARQFAVEVTTIHKMIKQGVRVQQLIQQVVDTIRVLGFERVAFALKVPKTNMLSVQFAADQDENRSLRQLKIPLDTPNLFVRLLEKPQLLQMQDANRTKLLKLIPPAIALKLNNERFVIMSVFNGQRPLGLMYADGVAQDLDEQRLKNFQALCRLLSKGVMEILAAQQKTVSGR